MTHIEQMIKDLCPQGVEWKKLAEVTYWDKRFNEVDRSLQPEIRKYHYYLANELEELESSTGNVRILYTSNKIAYADEDVVAESVVDAEIVAIPWGGNANIKYFKGKFITADNRIAVVRDPSVLNTKFLYYWLTRNQAEIDSYYRGAGIKHPSMLKVLSFEIPLPPIEIQEKIVECLDKFSALAAELQAELQLRRKQYEYYRTQLLTPHSDCNSANKTDDAQWEWKTLGEIFELRGGYTPSKNNPAFWEGGTIPWFRMEDIRLNGRILEDAIQHITPAAVKGKGLFEKNTFILATTATIGEHALLIADSLANQQFTNLKIRKSLENSLLTKFVFHYMFIVDEYCKAHTNVSGFESVDMDALKKMPFPIPPLAEQERIVSILDKFEALTTSLSDGIPAEQAAQQKRYEYYRDLLLTFPRKEV